MIEEQQYTIQPVFEDRLTYQLQRNVKKKAKTPFKPGIHGPKSWSALTKKFSKPAVRGSLIQALFRI